MNDPVTDLAAALSHDSDLKLWSVLITFLGDVSLEASTEVSGLALTALVDRIGLQPQAMRVALHRLKRDGWIDSRREGRVGYHRLSDTGVTQTRAVSDRVYGAGVPQADCHLVGLPPDAPDGLALLPDEIAAIAVSRSFALVSGPPDGLPDDWLVATQLRHPFPPWVVDVLQDAACDAAFAALTNRLSGLDLPTDPLDRCATRVLVLHAWRRLILRSNPAAEMALGEGRAELACRKAVHGVLSKLGPINPAMMLLPSAEVTP